jgi:hypothetical protein
LSDPNEPVLRVCGTGSADLRVDVAPDTGHVAFTTNPVGVVDRFPPELTGDGTIVLGPRPIPVGTPQAAGRETRLSVRAGSSSGPELPRPGTDAPGHVRIRQFQQIVASLFLHVVRRGNGRHPDGVTMEDIVTRLNTGLDLGNRIYGQACIRLRMRQNPGTTPKTSGYAVGDLAVHFIDNTSLLDITTTVTPGSVSFPTGQDQTLFTHNGPNQNLANPTFINVYVIEQFVDPPGTVTRLDLQGSGGIGANHLTVERTALNNPAALFAHEIGHCLGLLDLNVATVTDSDQRLMRSIEPRGTLLANGGIAGDETLQVRQRALVFTG